MQRHLYAQGGLQAEGIFRINAGNSQEEFLREQLNREVVPDDIDMHCLAGLIKCPPSAYVFDKIDDVVVMIVPLPDQFDGAVNKFPAIIHQVPLLEWILALFFSCLNNSLGERIESSSVDSTVSSLIMMDEDLHPHQFSSTTSKLLHSNGPTATGVHKLLECPVCTNSMYHPIHQIRSVQLEPEQTWTAVQHLSIA